MSKTTTYCSPYYSHYEVVASLVSRHPTVFLRNQPKTTVTCYDSTNTCRTGNECLEDSRPSGMDLHRGKRDDCRASILADDGLEDRPANWLVVFVTPSAEGRGRASGI